MSNDFDYDDIFKISGYEAALKFLLSQAIMALDAGVDPSTALVRFYTKANRLKSLFEKDRKIRLNSGGQDGSKKETKKNKTRQ